MLLIVAAEFVWFYDGDLKLCATIHWFYLLFSPYEHTKLYSFRNILVRHHLGPLKCLCVLTVALSIVCAVPFNRGIIIHYYFICLNWSLEPPGTVQISNTLHMIIVID